MKIKKVPIYSFVHCSASCNRVSNYQNGSLLSNAIQKGADLFEPFDEQFVCYEKRRFSGPGRQLCLKTYLFDMSGLWRLLKMSATRAKSMRANGFH